MKTSASLDGERIVVYGADDNCVNRFWVCVRAVHWISTSVAKLGDVVVYCPPSARADARSMSASPYADRMFAVARSGLVVVFAPSTKLPKVCSIAWAYSVDAVLPLRYWTSAMLAWKLAAARTASPLGVVVASSAVDTEPIDNVGPALG